MSFRGVGGYGQMGDPGFLSNIGHALIGGVTGFFTGGYPGAIAGAITGYGAATARPASMPGGSPPAVTPTTAAGTFGPTRLPAVIQPIGRAVGAVGSVLRTPGGAAIAGAAGGAALDTLLAHHAAAATGGLSTTRGFHMSKPYRCHGTVIPSHAVRNRRMNPCNVRALRRAARRAHSFLRISRKLTGYYTPHKHKGRAYIKARKRRG